ncbi:MAG: TonB-dependent receptor plug domain-containing protein [Deltaproteobacteria bacterium]
MLRRVVIPLALALWRISPRAFADESAPGRTTVLPPVDVPTSSEPEPAEDEQDPTSMATEIRASDYAGEQRSVAELTAAAPGATVHRLGDFGQLATVTLRGSSSDQILVLLDGVPLTSAAGGTVDLSTIPPELIDRIEILRGDAGARYGAGALGGVVNIVTKRPDSQLGEAQLGAGEWNSEEAEVSGALAGSRGGVALAASFLRSDGDFPYRFQPTPELTQSPLQSAVRQNDWSDLAGLVGSGSLHLGRSELTVVGQGSVGERGLAGPLYALTPTDQERFGRGLVGARLDTPHALGPLDLELSAHARVDELDVTLAPAGPLAQTDVEGGGSASLSYLVGAERFRGEVGAGRETLSAQDYGNPARDELFASLADEVTLLRERLLVIPAIRWDEQGQFSGTSPKLGISYRPLAPLELRANAGASFRAPTFAELYLQQGLVAPNPNLLPERGQSADVGVAFSQGPFLAQLSAFASAYQDLIVYEVYPPFAVKPFNIGQAWIEGLEAELSGRPLPSLTLSAAYTYLLDWDADPQSNTYGYPLPYRPPHHAHGRVAWQPGPFLATLEADAASPQSLNAAGSLTLPGHFVLDAGLGVRLLRRPELWLTAEVKNLTNDEAPDLYGYPLPGTSFFLTLRGALSPQPNHGADDR